VAFDALLTVQVPVVTVVALAVALGAGVDVVAAAVGASLVTGVAAPPHAASSAVTAASGAARRIKDGENIGSSTVCSSDLTGRKALSR